MPHATDTKIETITNNQQREVNEAKGALIAILGQVEAKHGRSARISRELDRLIVDLEMWQSRHADA